MIYLCHPSGRIEACETEQAAARLEARGFRRISREAYVERADADQRGVERAVVGEK